MEIFSVGISMGITSTVKSKLTRVE